MCLSNVGVAMPSCFYTIQTNRKHKASVLFHAWNRDTRFFAFALLHNALCENTYHLHSCDASQGKKGTKNVV